MNDLTLTERLTAWRAALENHTDTPEALETMWQGLLREVERLEAVEETLKEYVIIPYTAISSTPSGIAYVQGMEGAARKALSATGFEHGRPVFSDKSDNIYPRRLRTK